MTQELNYEHLIEFMADLAEKAGAGLLNHFRGSFRVEKKGETEDSIDIVTEADTESERLIMEAIKGEYPDHDILTEETETKRSGARHLWMIDPLDGTVNFSRGYPFFCVSLALLEDDRLLAGVVRDPYHNETFHGHRGFGAYLNNEPIKVSHSQTLRRSVLATGFPYDRAESPENNVPEFSRVAPRVQGIRRGGSAAMDLCYVACGRLDGFWELKLKPWDMAAGMLMVQEAGGKVTDDNGDPAGPGVHCIVATNGLIHEELVNALGR